MTKRGRPRINPINDEEWQEAVNCAQFGLELDSLFQYGLVEGRMEDGTVTHESGVNVRRCERILDMGAKKGFHLKKTDQPN